MKGRSPCSPFLSKLCPNILAFCLTLHIPPRASLFSWKPQIAICGHFVGIHHTHAEYLFQAKIYYPRVRIKSNRCHLDCRRSHIWNSANLAFQITTLHPRLTSHGISELGTLLLRDFGVSKGTFTVIDHSSSVFAWKRSWLKPEISWVFSESAGCSCPSKTMMITTTTNMFVMRLVMQVTTIILTITLTTIPSPILQLN